VNKSLQMAMKSIESLEGDIIDFRIGNGDVFIKMIKSLNKSKKHVFGIANYDGLDSPTEHDFKDGKCLLNAKKFSHNKRELLLKLQANVRLLSSKFSILEESTLQKNLDLIPETQYFSLAFIDLHQYAPTTLALNFLKTHLVSDGIIVINGYNQSDYAANKAVYEFLKSNKDYQILDIIEPTILLLIKKSKLEYKEVLTCIQSPITSKKITIACVLKTGGIYDFKYVNALANAVARNVTIPYQFTCITNDDTNFNTNVHKIIKFKHDFPKWWGKIELFRPHIFESEQVFFLDLDTVIIKNIDEIISYSGRFCGLRDFYKIVSLGSGLLSWQPKHHHSIYNNFLPKSRYIMNNTPEGDQRWIDDQVNKKDYFQDIFGKKIVSWKKHCIKNNKIFIPDEASIICFHGKPKPHEIQHETIVSNWKPYN